MEHFKKLLIVFIIKSHFRVHRRVDILLSCIFFMGFAGTVISQKLSKTDSLKLQFSNEKNIEAKIAIGNKLFYSIVRKDKAKGKVVIDSMLHYSLENGYDLGQAISYAGLGYYYRFLPDIDSSRSYYKKAVSIFDVIPLTKYHTSTYDDYGALEGLQGNFNTSLAFIEKGIQAALTQKNGRSAVFLLRRKGSMQTDMGNFDEALATLIEASKALDTLQIPNKKLQGIIAGQMSRIELSRGNVDQALPLIEESIALFETIDDKEFLAVAYNELGNILYTNKNYIDALDAYTKAKQAGEAIGYQFIIATVSNNMGKVYTQMKQFEKAAQSIDEGMALAKKYASLNNLAEGHSTKGNLFFESKRYIEAINQYSKAIGISDSIQAKEILAKVYGERALAYEKNGNIFAALTDFKNHKQLNDSIFSEKSANEIERLKIVYDTEKKEKEIALQARDIANLEEKEAKANAQRLVLGISLLSLLMIGGFAFYGVRQKNKREKAEKEKLNNAIRFKEKELTTHALHLAHKNEVLLNLKKQVTELKNTNSNTRSYQNIINNINLDINSDGSWEQFKNYFEDVHRDFNAKVIRTYPEVSTNDLRLMALLKMNLSSKEIANILNISVEGVKKARYRLRKKLALETEDSLEELVIKI